MTAKELCRILTGLGGTKLRQKGSHARWQVGSAQTTIPMHKGDLGRGLLSAVERDLAGVLGEDWLKQHLE